MMNLRNLILLAIALLLALAAVFVAQSWMSRQQQAALPPPAIETIPVVTASSQILPLEKIRPDQLKVMEIPKSALPFDASLPDGGLNFFSRPDEVVGKFATQTIFPSEFIVRQRIRDALGGSALSNLLLPSMRAVSVRVDDVTGVAGFLMPGNHVDILTTQKALDSELIATRLLLQNVKVLAVDQTAVTDDQGKPILARTVTVELKPQDASVLARASSEGGIQMSLRNPKDDLLLPDAMYLSRDDRRKPQPQQPRPEVATPVEQPRMPGSIRSLYKAGQLGSYECFKDHCQAISAIPGPSETEMSRMPRRDNRGTSGLDKLPVDTPSRSLE